MCIVKAGPEDIEGIEKLLYQVHSAHAAGRPDIFKKGDKKYTREQLKNIINNADSPVYIYKSSDGKVIAHAFIKYEVSVNKTMYIDDICVDKEHRHKGICSKILSELQCIAKENNCYRITLNVYTFNREAVRCYEKFGMTPYSMHLEKIIK